MTESEEVLAEPAKFAVQALVLAPGLGKNSSIDRKTPVAPTLSPALLHQHKLSV